MTDTIITKSIILSVPKETVWSYLTDKTKLGLWFFAAEDNLADKQDFVLIKKEDDGSTSNMCWGSVLEMIRPDRLVYSFTIKPLDGLMTTVTWTLEEVYGGTKLSLVHEGIDAVAGEAAMGLILALDNGWDKHLAGLRSATA